MMVKMYKIKIKLSEEKLSKSKQKELYKKIDKIFNNENILKTIEKDTSIYSINRQQDYGLFWSAIFQLKSNKKISENLIECTYWNGKENEDLIENFINQ